jgi:fructose-bisphosphate aldolase class II
MPVVNLKEVLDKAIKHDYAVGAFNVHNLEFVEGVMRAAEEMSSPVIIGIATISIAECKNRFSAPGNDKRCRRCPPGFSWMHWTEKRRLSEGNRTWGKKN